MEPFLLRAPISTSKLERLAEDCGLPGSIVTQASGVIPLHALERFMVTLDACIGDPLFLLNSLQNDAKKHERSIANVPMPCNVTGFEAVGAIVEQVNAILSGARFLCEHSGDKIWVLRTAGTTDWTDIWAVQQYNLGYAMLAIDRVIGRPIRPVAIRLNDLRDSRVLPDELSDLPIQLSHATMGLAFDCRDLIRGTQRLFVDSVHVGQYDATTNEELDVERLSACIVGLLSSTVPESLSHRAASAFGISERSYRRRLRELGISHSTLVADARLATAERMLREPDLSITEIAFELGYANLPAFTRFFTSRVGISPAAYRRTAQQ